ncbi:TonB-dependent receptor [Niabella beijingensis]|uniref:TonB-dependent receptor n=1 Tax=Niabella beijingensis TaxID=2872700 RepID=UPI001CBEA48B|nr:TonB-dependent receptor [Niabella beijingensis]MBZ4189142.1 TonB-dependent receptor [Niabella beijingensis]
MKLTMLFLLFFTLNVCARGFGQEHINLRVKKVAIAEVFKSIEAKTSYRFLYNNDLPELRSKVTLNAQEATIDQILPMLLFNTGMTFRKMDNNLIVIREDSLARKDIAVTGKVTDSSGAPLSGVSVQVKGTTVGTATNAEGTFSLSVPDANSVLVFTAVGYEEQEYPLNGSTSVTISLKPSQQLMDQVVVIGYGTARKRDLTGSVASVKGEELAKQPVQTATQALQGKVAGVQIIGSGEPNSNPNVRIRGTGSVMAGVNPLYVVDGVLTDDIRNINNADIVSMDILKDASATAIYGVRGANGVIIITTKKGRAGKTVFNYTGTAAIKEATNLVDMAGEKQYAGYLNEASNYYGSGQNLIDPAKLVGNNTDWYDVILRKAFQQSHNLSMSGGNDKFLFFMSAGYLSDEGIQKDNQFNRFTLRSNNEYTLNKWIKFNSQLSYTRGDGNNPNADAFGFAYRAAPYVASKTGDKYGNTSLAGNVSNPLLVIDKNYNNFITNRIQGNFGIDLKPIKELTFRTALNFDLNFFKNTTYAYPFLSDTSTFIEGGGNQSRTASTLTAEKNDWSTLIWDNTLTYTKTFNKHSLTALAGFVAERQRFNNFKGSALNVPQNKDQWYLNAGSAGSQTVQNDGDLRTRLSYLGRVFYSYDSRYLITATLRADGSSKFGSNQRYGYFPSVALGWNIAEESFMEDQEAFNVLKLRAGYGAKGNDNIPSDRFTPVATQNLPYYFPSGSSVIQGIAFDQASDPNVRWEITKELNIGLDFATLQNRLSGTIDYYDKKTNNALIEIGLSAIVFDADNKYITNATTISNKGIELGLNWNDKIGNDWTYSLGGNIAYNKNNIEELNGGQPLIGGTAGNYNVTRTDNGYPIASYYVLQAAGIFQNQAQIDASAQPDARAGDLIYKDLSGPNGTPDGKIDDFDRAFSGSYQPKITYGVNGNIAYKNFDLSFGGYGLSGAKIYNGKKAARGVNQLTDNVEASVAKNRWTPNNTNTGVPRANAGALPASTYFIESGDFFRLNNLTIGYTMKSPFLDRIKVSNCRLYLSAQNLFTITPYSGFTPEILTVNAGDPRAASLDQGVDLNTYPSVRTYVIGINLGF